jgi:uncharacterized protein (DUF1778 family)
MPRLLADNSRIELRVHPEEKAALARAAAFERTDLASFVLRTVLPAARTVIERAERLELSERDSLKVPDLLENPPAPNARLRGAAKALRGQE